MSFIFFMCFFAIMNSRFEKGGGRMNLMAGGQTLEL